MSKYTEAIELLKIGRDQLYKKINENPIVEKGLSNELYAFDSAITLLIELIEGAEDE